MTSEAYIAAQDRAMRLAATGATGTRVRQVKGAVDEYVVDVETPWHEDLVQVRDDTDVDWLLAEFENRGLPA